jgi:WD40 repeat protein
MAPRQEQSAAAALIPVTTMGHPGRVLRVAFSPDGQLLVTTSEGGGARLWGATNGAAPAANLSEGGAVLTADFSADGQSLATLSADGRARLWSLTGRKASLPTLSGIEAPVNALSFDATGERLLAGANGSAYLWPDLNRDAPSPTLVRKGAGAGPGQYRMGVSPDRKRIISWWSVERAVTVTELGASGHRRVAGLPSAAEVSALALSPDGMLAVVADSRGAAAVWRVEGGGEAARAPLFTLGHDRTINSVAFSPDGRLIVTGGEDGVLKAWDVSTRLLIFQTSYTGSINSVAFSPDGRYLAAAGRDPAVHILSLSDRQEVNFDRRIIHRGIVSAVAFSPDGRYLATAGRDGTARVWEMARGREVARVNVGEPVSAVAFSGDPGRRLNGPYLATGVASKAAGDPSGPAVRLWYWRREEMVRDACVRLATRSLSRDEWEQYMETPLPPGDEPPQTCRD